MTSFVAGSGANRWRRCTDVATAIDIAIEAIGNHFDRPLHLQFTASRVAQALRYRRDAVRLLDRVGHDLRERRIAANERDVGPVQRRHDPRDELTARLEHLPRQDRRRRVRDRVVRVDDLELELARDLHDLVRERQHVLRLAKERIARRIDLVKHQAGLIVAEAEWRVGADEMHLVATGRQCLRELGGNDAAAADGGVADDSDIQAGSLI